MTIFYRCLAEENLSLDTFRPAYYEDALPHNYIDEFAGWLNDYLARRAQDEISSAARQDAMNAVNPKYVFRNYLAQQAIDKAEAGDHSMVNELLEVFRRPYDEQAEFEHYAAKRPEWAKTKVGCSMLSCSS